MIFAPADLPDFHAYHSDRLSPNTMTPAMCIFSVELCEWQVFGGIPDPAATMFAFDERAGRTNERSKQRTNGKPLQSSDMWKKPCGCPTAVVC